MTRKNKKLTAAIGLGIGITIFAGAALAGYNTSNGYEIGKKAAKGLLRNENYTLDASMTFTIDGEQIAKATINELYDRNGDVKLNLTESETNLNRDVSNNYRRYWQGNNNIQIYTHDDGKENALVEIGDGREFYNPGSLDIMSEMTDEKDRDTFNKVIRFAELAADTFVGDLKNNIVYVSGGDEGSKYEMNLDAVQIPELANAGLSAFLSSINITSYDDYPLYVLGTDPIIKNASLKFTVDSEGRLTEGYACGTMAGSGHEAKLEMSLNIYDYGTTQPQRIDISTLKNVDYTDNYRMITVLEDGTATDHEGNVVGRIEINADSSGNVYLNRN